ncbi:hypothetical protein WDU94_013500 [Cyamophila willieti]
MATLRNWRRRRGKKKVEKEEKEEGGEEEERRKERRREKKRIRRRRKRRRRRRKEEKKKKKKRKEEEEEEERRRRGGRRRREKKKRREEREGRKEEEEEGGKEGGEERESSIGKKKNKIKVFLEELKDILNTCVINNNDIFLVSDSLEGLSNNYNQNILLRRTILKDSIAKYLKLIAFTEAFNKEYQEELFLLYIFYLNCAEQFLSSIFHLNSKYPLVIFHVVKLINVILQFIYLSYCCYMVKKQNSELELMLINYNNLCEQDMFNLINLLLHKLNINGMDFSALDFVYIDMEMFIKTTVGLGFLIITLVTEKDTLQ